MKNTALVICLSAIYFYKGNRNNVTRNKHVFQKKRGLTIYILYKYVNFNYILYRLLPLTHSDTPMLRVTLLHYKTQDTLQTPVAWFKGLCRV